MKKAYRLKDSFFPPSKYPYNWIKLDLDLLFGTGLLFLIKTSFLRSFHPG